MDMKREKHLKTFIKFPSQFNRLTMYIIVKSHHGIDGARKQWYFFFIG